MKAGQTGIKATNQRRSFGGLVITDGLSAGRPHGAVRDMIQGDVESVGVAMLPFLDANGVTYAPRGGSFGCKGRGSGGAGRGRGEGVGVHRGASV